MITELPHAVAGGTEDRRRADRSLCRLNAGFRGLTDRLAPQRPAIQLIVVATMLGTLLLAAAAPEAFGRRGLAFAGTYLTVHIGRAVFFMLVLRSHEVRRLGARQLVWFGVSAVP
jgi:low temperature requirement protein LtrA